MFIYNFFDSRAVWFNPLGHKEQATKRHYIGAVAIAFSSLGIMPMVYGLTQLIGRCCLANTRENRTASQVDQLQDRIPTHQVPNISTNSIQINNNDNNVVSESLMQINNNSKLTFDVTLSSLGIGQSTRTLHGGQRLKLEDFFPSYPL